MASGLYKDFKKKCLESTASDLSSETVIKAYLVRTSAYTVNLTTHDFIDDVPTRAAGPVTLTTTTTDSPEGGVFDAANITFSAVGAGAAIDCLVIYEDTGGAESTDPLIAYIDGFSVTPNGGDISVNWDNGSNRIFKL